MAYREDTSERASAPTAEGVLTAEFFPRKVLLSVAHRRLEIDRGFATLIDESRRQRTTLAIEGLLFTARDVPREDFSVWMELVDRTPHPRGNGMRRIFGVEPVSLLTEEGLPALAALDRLAHRTRIALDDVSPVGGPATALELGQGLDKVLVVKRDDRHVIYARPLFRDRARFILAIHNDGRIDVPDGKTTRQIVVRSQFGITVWRESIRFADPSGVDLARVSIPRIGRPARDELARRIAQLVDLDSATAPA